jgi:hypothetical protein
VISLMIGLLIGITTIGSFWLPEAATTLEKLLPSLTLVIGFYFGRMQA